MSKTHKTRASKGHWLYWNSSTAVKLIAPVLWLVALGGMILAVAIYSSGEQKLEKTLGLQADQIAFSVGQTIYQMQEGHQKLSTNIFKGLLEDTYFDYGELTFGHELIRFSSKTGQLEKIRRQLNIIANGKDNYVVNLYHKPLVSLVQAQQASRFISFGLPYFVFCLCVIGLIYFVIARPTMMLLKATERLTHGDMESRINTENFAEFGNLGEFFNNIVDTLSDTRKQLGKEVEIANKASNTKSAFLANMSHEIRTPLTAIIGFSDILREGGHSPAEFDHVMESIVRAGNHLQEIINDILDLSKIEAEQLVIEQIDTPLFEVVNEVYDIMNMRAEEKSLRCEVKYVYPLPEVINSDPTRLRQILLNLCSNAIKFTDQGLVELVIKYLDSEDKIQIDVIDQGIGMDEEEQARLFKPFSQADSSTTREYGGTGLGLCISKQLANKMGGDISCSSEKGKGSHFTVIISAGDVAKSRLVTEGAHVVVQPKAKDVVPPVNLCGKVLLAEDTPDNQHLISLYIRRTGAIPVVVSNGKLAVERASKEVYDLILMDMQMPVMGGIEAIETLRKSGYKHPIVALTANALKEDQDRCRAAGTDDFLTKPVDLNKFYTVMSRYLKVDDRSNQENIVDPLYDFEGDEEMLKLIDTFLRDLPTRLGEIIKAYENEDWVQLQAFSHTLKGIGTSFGFPVITEKAHILNTCLKTNNLSEVERNVTDLAQVCSEAIEYNQNSPTRRAG